MAFTAIDRIWDKGYNSIRNDENAWKQQVAWITEAAEDIRKMPAQELINRQFLYVPNDIYVLHYFGSEIAEYKYGVYRNEQCNFYKRLMFPVMGFNNQVAGLGGWANDSEWKYVYSPDTLWDKQRYFYCDPKDFAKALDDDYIIIVDGIFDAINLNRIGLHAVSLMGSTFSNWHRYYIRLIKYVIIIPDNDSAGVNLVKKIRKFRQDAIVLWQGKYKDIDDYIKNKDVKGLIEQCNDLELLQNLQTIKL